MSKQSRNTQLIAKFTLSHGDRIQNFELHHGDYSHGYRSDYKRVETWFIFDENGKEIQKSYGKGINKIKKYLSDNCPERKKYGINLEITEIHNPELLKNICL